MATSEEAAENDNIISNAAAAAACNSCRCRLARTSTCLSCATDATNCLMGVCFFHMNAIYPTLTMSARKRTLYKKNDKMREEERRSARGGRRPRQQREGNDGYSSSQIELWYQFCNSFCNFEKTPIHSFASCTSWEGHATRPSSWCCVVPLKRVIICPFMIPRRP
jgi:hypothetical protein